MRALGSSFARLCVALALAVAAHASASAADAFSVSGVTVDATAATAAAARDAALAEGQRKAFRMLLERLTSPADQARLPKLSDAELVPLVAGFEVQTERTSAVRYLATLTYNFRPGPVRALLKNNGIAFAETGSRSVLLVPVLKTGGTTLLWEDNNLWRRVWLDQPPPTGLVPVTVPSGGVEDLAALTTQQAETGAPAAFAGLLQRYNSGEVMVADATLDPKGVLVVVRRPGIAEPLVSEQLTPTAVEGQPELLRRAAVRTAQALEERWKREIMVSRTEANAETGGLVVRVPLTSINDWLETRRRLEATGFVQSVSLRSLSRREAIVGLGFAGDPAQLKLVLAQRQLALEESPDGWILRVLGVQAQTGERAAPPQ